MPIRTMEELEARRAQAARHNQSIQRRVIVCAGTGCTSNGSLEVFAALKEQAAAANLPVSFELDQHDDADHSPVYMTASGCPGLCQMGPLVQIQPDNILYTRVKASHAADIVEKTLKNGEVIDRLLYRNPATKKRTQRRHEIPFYTSQTRNVLRRCGEVDPTSLDAYLATDGFTGLQKALTEMSPEQVRQEVEASGLRGRGGAGFPAGLKWKLAAEAPGNEKYIICNGDEGDPGAFMDCSIMEGDPFSLLEGIMLAGYAIGSRQGLIYVRYEYPLAVSRLTKTIAILQEEGLLGENILGSGFDFNIEIERGAGVFVCGEETAMIHAIHGQRGSPRPKPPFPVSVGLYGKPTSINNVETLANVENIIANGAARFKAVGTKTSPGTKAFSITGNINATGLIEVPMGTSIREIIYDIGGGIPNEKPFKAVQMGGPSGGCVGSEHIDIKIDYESLRDAGAMMGSGGMVIIDDDTCIVEFARFFLDFTQKESCGKCAPCRIGTRHLVQILEKIIEGNAEESDLERLEKLCNTIKKGSLCGLGQTAPNPVLTSLRYFREEYEAHVRDKYCPAAVCKNLFEYHIDPEKCTGCQACVKVCPTDAITGEKKGPHQISLEACIKCRACYKTCQFDAIIGKPVPQIVAESV